MSLMIAEKSPVADSLRVAAADGAEDVAEKEGTARDQKDMYRLGKHQSLRVKARFWPHNVVAYAA